MRPLDRDPTLVVMNGYEFWIERLRPYAAEGFKRGVLYPDRVELQRDVDGARAVLARPRGGWLPASAIVRDAETERLLEADRRHELAEGGRALLAALMRVGTEEEP